MSTHPPRTPRLELDVALMPVDCAAPDCTRTMQPGDTLVMRQIEGARGLAEPLCAVHGAEAQEDARLRVRLYLHAVRQAG